MTTNDFQSLENFTVAVEGEGRNISGVYCADLLSWAMGRAPADSAWCTIMGNVNAVAVASLTDVAAIILCEDAFLDEDAKNKAKEKGVIIIKTSLPAFEAGTIISNKINS